jgi:galactonate dehydratase
MRITNVKTFLVEGIKYNWTLLKIETDAGLHGWGEATNWPGSPLVEAACQHVGDFITGLDARRIDYIWTKIYRDMNWSGQAGPLLSAISGVDIALWDIKGKRWAFQSMRCLGAVLRQNLIPTPNASHWSHITPVNMLYPVFQVIEIKGG